MKLEKGMYVRYSRNVANELNTTIGKITQLDDMRCFIDDWELSRLIGGIFKSSYNLIDLIEVGDYVNGYKVSKVGDDRYGKYSIYCDFIAKDYYHNDIRTCKIFHNEDINEILTKEQYENNIYRVKE